MDGVAVSVVFAAKREGFPEAVRPVVEAGFHGAVEFYAKEFDFLCFSRVPRAHDVFIYLVRYIGIAAMWREIIH